MNFNKSREFNEGVKPLDLKPIAPLQPLREVVTPRSRMNGRHLFGSMVVLPTLLALIYFTFVAAPQFASETRFTIRSPHRNAAGFLSGFLQSTGFVRAQDDSYSVMDFIRSRAAVEELSREDNLRDIFARSDADFVTRFPQFWAQPTQEALFKHYLKFIRISTDNGSGITTLEVRAFRSEDARDLALALLRHAEGLINRLNDRARQDAIIHSQIEVKNGEQRLAEAQGRITEFRNREAMIDPTNQSTTVLDLIARLSADVAEKKAQLSQIERQTAQSPMISALRANITATENQISLERAKVVGNDGSIAPRIALFEQLVLERELATRMLASATSSLENAKLDAQRQQLYLERIVEPHLPDHALYPKSLYMILMTAAVAFAIYGIAYMLITHVYEHIE